MLLNLVVYLKGMGDTPRSRDRMVTTKRCPVEHEHAGLASGASIRATHSRVDCALFSPVLHGPAAAAVAVRPRRESIEL